MQKLVNVTMLKLFSRARTYAINGLGGSVRGASRYPISDQNLLFSLPFLGPLKESPVSDLPFS